MSKEAELGRIDRLRKIQKEILELTDEAGEIVKKYDYREWEMAFAHWILDIKAAIGIEPGVKLEMCTMEYTISLMEAEAAEITHKKDQELREVVESELRNVTAAQDRVLDATRNWSPETLLREHISEDIAGKNTHKVSLQLILDKINETAPLPKTEAEK